MKIISSKFILSAFKPVQLKPYFPKQIAFVGRSNVGKSSLINFLLNRKSLALVSQVPGKTQSVNYYDILTEYHHLTFVDLPGFGFAKIPAGMHKDWDRLMTAFLETTPELLCLCLLWDVRRDLGDEESWLIQHMLERNISWTLIITKADKMKTKSELNRRLAAIYKQIDGQIDKANIFTASSTHNEGRDEIWKFIGRLARDKK